MSIEMKNGKSIVDFSYSKNMAKFEVFLSRHLHLLTFIQKLLGVFQSCKYMIFLQYVHSLSIYIKLSQYSN